MEWVRKLAFRYTSGLLSVLQKMGQSTEMISLQSVISLFLYQILLDQLPEARKTRLIWSWTVFIVFGEQKFTHIVIACNTAHIFIDQIEETLGSRPVSLIEGTTNYIQQKGIKRVGLLASPTTLKLKLYESPLKSLGIIVTLPDSEQQVRIEELNRKTIAGNFSLVNQLLFEINRLKTETDVDQILLGCTELSVIAEVNNGIVGTIDPLTVVVNEIFNPNQL